MCIKQKYKKRKEKEVDKIFGNINLLTMGEILPLYPTHRDI